MADTPAITPPTGYSLDSAPAEAPQVTPPAGYTLDASPAAAPETLLPATPARTGNTGVAGVLSGIGGEVMETAQGGIELANKVLPSSVQIPSIPPEYRENITPSEKVGGFAENVGEFATGEEILKGMSRIAKLEKLAQSSPTVAKIIHETPDFIKKIVGSATKAAAVGGAQGAVKGAAEGDAVGGAEAGAAGGAIGGAAGEVIGPVLRKGAKAVGLATSAEEDIMRAAKPGKRNDRFLADWDLAKDRYAKELDANGKYEDLTDAAERMRGIRQDLWKTEVKPKIDAHATEDMFPNASLPAPPGSIPASNPIADSIRSRITTAKTERASPSYSKALETYAKRFDGPMKVGEAEGILERINAELEDLGYWQKNPSQKAMMEKANPAVAGRVAAGDSLRESLYSHLDSAGEKNIQQLKRTYGAMRNVENEVRGQVNVASRQAPISLKQIIALASGHPLGIAATLADKIYNDPAAILNRAVSKAAPGAVRAAAQDLASGAGTVAKTALPAVTADTARAVHTGITPAPANIGSWVPVTGSDGQAYRVHPEDVAEVMKRDPSATVDWSKPLQQ